MRITMREALLAILLWLMLVGAVLLEIHPVPSPPGGPDVIRRGGAATGKTDKGHKPLVRGYRP